MLMFWCSGDLDRVDRLFRQSGLMRDKWDRKTGEDTYGAKTILALRQPVRGK
jgi:primase-polymerase (primpol)-like protein